MTEPIITVSRSEYFRELGRISGKVRRLRKLYSEWGRYASLWRWRRRVEDLESLRAVMRRIAPLRRELGAERLALGRKLIRAYWRVGLAYMFAETRLKPPYHFYAEFRITIFTQHPELYAIWDEREKQYKNPKPELEEEMREILFASSVLARRRKDGTVAHVAWLEALWERRVLPFPDFECVPVDEREVEKPLDTKHYYVRFEEARKRVEYGTADVESWLRAYREWVREMQRAGIIRHPRAYMRAVRQTSIEDFLGMIRKRRGKRRG